MNSIINWSEVSKLLTNNPRQIRKDYSGKKYKKEVNRIKRIEKALRYFINKHTNK